MNASPKKGRQVTNSSHRKTISNSKNICYGPKSPGKNNNNLNLSPKSQNNSNQSSVGNIPTQFVNLSKMVESQSKSNKSKTNGILSSSRILDVSSIQVSFLFFLVNRAF